MRGEAEVLACACRSVPAHRTAVAGRRIAVIVAAAGVISGTTALPALAGASAASPPKPHQQENSSPPDRASYTAAPRAPPPVAPAPRVTGQRQAHRPGPGQPHRAEIATTAARSTFHPCKRS